MRRLLAVAAVALALPGAADAARFAVGVAPGADPAELTRTLETRTGGSVQPLGPFAVVLETDDVEGVAGLPGVAYVERLGTRGRRLAFVPTDPFVTRQWHLGAVQAFDAWAQRPTLPGMRIAVIDSGVDAGHPDLAGRIADVRSFVGGSARTDRHGHGTFISGLIAASLNNGQGIAGMAFPAQLLVAKVVRRDGIVPLEAEARAIRWAVDQNAQVINLSLGGVRHPQDPTRDSFSRLEASAVEYAIRKGVIVVAAVGNGDNAPEQPWRYASYPAALPHVLGVSAVARDGSVPMFSNRDPVYNDIAAPGDELFSTLPRPITAQRPLCELQGYSDCGPQEYRRPQGTSFAAAIVSAGAVLVRGSWPNLRREQVVALLQRTATDMTPATGCRRCGPGRDPITGWGRLNVAAAVNYAGRLAPIDYAEPNDDSGARAFRVRKRTKVINASLDYWEDQNDVYAVRLPRGGRLVATLSRANANVDLVLWRPGTRRISQRRTLQIAAESRSPGGFEVVRFGIQRRIRRAGIYYLQVTLAEPGSAGYTLRIVRR
ncbi:MAG TPA: S8 family serine peptidase [Gaiellaceae bacterium]